MLHQLLVPKRSSQCCRCEAFFVAGTYFTSCLKEEKRSDFCEKCAEAEVSLTSWEAVWRSQVLPEPPKLKKVKVMSGKERAIALLRELSEKHEAEKTYLLALYLERRKVLQKVKELHRKRGNFLLYRSAIEEELFVVPKLERLSNREARERELLEALIAIN